MYVYVIVTHNVSNNPPPQCFKSFYPVYFNDCYLNGSNNQRQHFLTFHITYIIYI